MPSKTEVIAVETDIGPVMSLAEAKAEVAYRHRNFADQPRGDILNEATPHQ